MSCPILQGLLTLIICGVIFAVRESAVIRAEQHGAQDGRELATVTARRTQCLKGLSNGREQLCQQSCYVSQAGYHQCNQLNKPSTAFHSLPQPSTAFHRLTANMMCTGMQFHKSVNILNHVGQRSLVTIAPHPIGEEN